MESKKFIDGIEYKQIMPAVEWWAQFEDNPGYNRYEELVGWAIVEKDQSKPENEGHYNSKVVGLIASKKVHWLVNAADEKGFIRYIRDREIIRPPSILDIIESGAGSDSDGRALPPEGSDDNYWAPNHE